MPIAANSQLGNFQHFMSPVELMRHLVLCDDARASASTTNARASASTTIGTNVASSATGFTGTASRPNSNYINRHANAVGAESPLAMRHAFEPIDRQPMPLAPTLTPTLTPALEPLPKLPISTVRLPSAVVASPPASVAKVSMASKPARTVRLSQPSATQNKLLALLPPAALERFAAYLEWIPMPLGKVLYEAGDQLKYVYFPSTSIVSLSYALSDGASAEVAIVGNEGMVGISLVMGCETTPTQAFVQSAGYGFRLKASVMVAELQHTGAAMQLFLKYAQALMVQMTQTAVCNRHHSLAQQLSRRLLLSLDRGSTHSLKMTQELMATILGVRREGVTEAAGKLQREGLIRYSRGVIEILDREGLERASCECYSVVKLEFNRLFSSPAKDSSSCSAPDDPTNGARLRVQQKMNSEMNSETTTKRFSQGGRAPATIGQIA